MSQGDSDSVYDAKPAYKRWAVVHDEEAKPLTDQELETRSPTYQAAYRQAMIDDPLPVGHRYAAGGSGHGLLPGDGPFHLPFPATDPGAVGVDFVVSEVTERGFKLSSR